MNNRIICTYIGLVGAGLDADCFVEVLGVGDGEVDEGVVGEAEIDTARLV